jgi:hypothetical protein
VTTIPFLETLTASGLEQHVTSSDHKKGHTLDLLITRISDQVVFSNLHIIDGISDHYAVICNLFLSRPPVITKTITTRNWKSIESDKLSEDILKSDLCVSLKADICSKVQQYTSDLSVLLNKHAPSKTRRVKIRPNTSWYSDHIYTEKRKRRRLEQKWRKSRLEIDHQLYIEQKQKVISLIKKAKASYYNNLCAENTKNPKRLFGIVNQLQKSGIASP